MVKFLAVWESPLGNRYEREYDGFKWRVEVQEQWRRDYAEHAAQGAWPKVTLIATCCGVDLLCDAFTVTCDKCGSDFNSAGQRLAPRAQWGEETGEHWQECY